MQDRLETETVGRIPLEATDHLGVIHRLWPVTDVKTIAEVSALIGPKPIFVADGHHRYETARNYCDQLAAKGDLPAAHPARCVVLLCGRMSDPGMIVLPTHRLFRDFPAISSQQLCHQLEGFFSTELAGEGPGAALPVWDRIEQRDDQGTLALYAAVDRQWVLCQVTDQGRRKMAEVAATQSQDWRQLGVASLHRLDIETLLASGLELSKPRYVHQVSEVIEALEADRADAPQYSLAALVMPATISHIQTISEHAERMPAKSTYFYPKLLSGLVLNPLE